MCGNRRHPKPKAIQKNLNENQLRCRWRATRGKFGETLGFELLVVHDDAAAIPEGIAQR
jgi:hypothetical protein